MLTTLVFFAESPNPCTAVWACRALTEMARVPIVRKQLNSTEYSWVSRQTQMAEYKTTGVQSMFSIMRRQLGDNYAHPIAAQIVLWAAVALEQMLSEYKYAENVGLTQLDSIQLLVRLFKEMKDQSVRVSLAGVVAVLAQVPHNAQILIQMNICDYLALLTFQFTGTNQQLIMKTCAALQQVVKNAPVRTES